MNGLHEAVRRSAAELRALLLHIEAEHAPVPRSVKRNLDLQLRGLVTLEQELGAGRPTRRVWSLGQASIPVLGSLLNAVQQRAPALDPSPIDRCRESLTDLGDPLVAYAEGRSDRGP